MRAGNFAVCAAFQSQQRAGADEASDSALVLRAQQGDQAALTQLLERYAPRLFNLCLRLVGQRADAEDLTQTALLYVIQALPRFEPRARFYTWAYRIAVNAALSHRRKARPVALADADVRASDASADPLEAAETRLAVAAALARMPAEFRAAVLLKDVEDMDYADIAEVLEIPLGTVKSRIARGRLWLRAALDSGGGAAEDRA